MVQFNWGIPLKAPLPFDGQPFVDDAGHVWQWDASAQAWVRANYLEMRKVRTSHLQTKNKLLGVDVFDTRRSGTLGREWDDVYALSFVEVWSMAGALLGRRAHMDRAALSAWIDTVVPDDGVQLTEDCTVNVYEIFDSRQGLVRWHAWNGLYSSFRGRGCYYGDHGYGRSWPAQGNKGGYSPQFVTWHPANNLETSLMDYFYGITPGTTEPRACWSAGNRRSPHNIPRSSPGVIMDIPAIGQGGRRAWDWGSSDWAVAQAGDWEIFTVGLLRQNPCHVYRGNNEHSLNFSEPKSSLRGYGAIWGSTGGPEGIEGMLAFCIRSSVDNNHVAFLLKPLGITKCAFTMSGGVSAATHDVIASGHYRNKAGDGRFANLSSMGLVEDRTSDGIRVRSLASALNATASTHHTPTNSRPISVDTSLIPREVHFYVRHKTTGIRSAEFDSSVRVERRKSGMPVSLMDNRR